MYYNNILCHHGILGQRWGVRRYQNPDGSLTTQGRERYGIKAEKEKAKFQKVYDKNEQTLNKLKTNKKIANDPYKIKLIDHAIARNKNMSKAMNKRMSDLTYDSIESERGYTGKNYIYPKGMKKALKILDSSKINNKSMDQVYNEVKRNADVVRTLGSISAGRTAVNIGSSIGPIVRSTNRLGSMTTSGPMKAAIYAGGGIGLLGGAVLGYGLNNIIFQDIIGGATTRYNYNRNLYQ